MDPGVLQVMEWDGIILWYLSVFKPLDCAVKLVGCLFGVVSELW